MPYHNHPIADIDNKGANAVSEQASADKLEYAATLGIIAMEGRGFEYPTDMVAASNGRLYVANRSRDFGERGVRVTVLDLASEYYGTFGHFGATDGQLISMVASIAGDNAPSETLVDRCLDWMGALRVSRQTRATLLTLAQKDAHAAAERATQMMRLAAAPREIRRV